MAQADVATPGSKDASTRDDRHTALVDQIGVFARAGAEDDIARLLDLMLDGVGVALAGRSSHASRSAETVFEASHTAWDAAWLHGIRMHTLDFDDTHERSLCHTATALLPGLLALGRDHGRSGRELLDAYDIGIRFVDFAADCGRALNAAGAHSTAILGALSAAAACGWLLTHDTEATADAVELAALQAAGLGVAFGSDGKSLQAARAAEIGVRSALFAAGGLSAPRGAAFGDRGVFALWLGRDAPASVPWGDDCAGAAARVAIKPYPSCFLTHSTIDAALELRRSLDLRHAGDVRMLHVEVHPLAEAIADKAVLGSENAKFSLRFCALAALVDGRVNVDTFSPEAQRRLTEDAGSFDAWVAKFAVRTAAAGPQLTARVEVSTADGRERRITVEAPRGSGSHPLTRDDVIAKFRDNAARDYGDEAVQRLLDEVMAVPSARDIRELGSLISACTPDRGAPDVHAWSANGKRS